MFKILIFIIVSVGIVFILHEPLFAGRRKGYYRFIAFESTLILILLNINFWLKNPFSFFQIISWLLLVSSAVYALESFYLLRKMGKPEDKIIEHTTRLVTSGLYKYIRHPLYAAVIFLAWGTFLKHFSILGIILAVIATIFLIYTAIIEEKEALKKFGIDYASYMKKTKRFIPFSL